MTELADLLGLERTTLTRIGAVLERNGWLAMAPSKDARQRRLRLTGAGRRKIGRSLPGVEGSTGLGRAAGGEAHSGGRP